MIISLYTDGGVIERNPSSIGGTWAWCAVDENNIRVLEHSGAVPCTKRPITNNHTEQIAIVLALEAMERGWSGKLYSDSRIAIMRVFRGARTHNLPSNIIDRSHAATARLGLVTAWLLQGHPTKADLEAGIGRKRGLPVSEHNVWCDKACGLAAQEFKQSHAIA